MKDIIVAVVLAFCMVFVVGLIMSYPVMLLWNGCFVGAISGVNEITWLQAWGIMILTGLLFKTGTSTSKK